MWPLQDDSRDEESCDGAKLEECEELITKEEENSPTKFSEEGAATLIQSTFRGFMVFSQTTYLMCNKISLKFNVVIVPNSRRNVID